MPRQVCRTIGFWRFPHRNASPRMKRAAAWIIPFVAVVGCQSGVTPTKAEVATESTAVPAVASPIFTESRLFLLRNGLSLKIGVPQDEAEKIFEPDGSNFQFSDLPGKFKQPYRGQGWETARESFGVISYQQRVTVAMVQQDRATAQDFEELRETYRNTFSAIDPVTVEGKKVQAEFWRDGDQTLMVIGTQTGTGTVQVTVALGLDSVMSEIGATPETVRDQALSVDQTFSREVPK